MSKKILVTIEFMDEVAGLLKELNKNNDFVSEEIKEKREKIERMMSQKLEAMQVRAAWIQERYE